MNEHIPTEADDELSDRLRRSLADVDAPALSPELVTAAPGRHAPRLVNHGRATRAASASLIAVAAVAAGSLVIVNPFAPNAPLFTAAQGGAAAESMSMADSRIALWIDYRYVAGDGLSSEPGRGSVYQLRRVGSAEQVLRDVAAEFGLSGEPAPSSYFDPAYPMYGIGPEDGTAPSITVTWSGTGNWGYNNPAAYPEPVCELVPYETDEGEQLFEECMQPRIAASESRAPSAQQARAAAAEIFAASGLAVTAADIRITADEWQTMASANLTVDGVATALDYGVAWSPTGEIAWAYGHSVEVVERGGFDTVSAVEAVDRLADWRWFAAAGPDYQGGMQILAAESGLARDAGVTDEEPGAVEPGREPLPVDPEPTEPVEEPTVEPLPEITDEPIVEPVPVEPQTVTVTVDSAEPTLLLMWDSAGEAWLVPGYAMRHPDGWWNAIVSLVEGVIALPEPIELEPMPYREG